MLGEERSRVDALAKKLREVVAMCSQYKQRTRALQQSLVDSQRQVEIGKAQIVQLSKLMAKATIA